MMGLIWHSGGQGIPAFGPTQNALLLYKAFNSACLDLNPDLKKVGHWSDGIKEVWLHLAPLCKSSSH